MPKSNGNIKDPMYANFKGLNDEEISKIISEKSKASLAEELSSSIKESLYLKKENEKLEWWKKFPWLPLIPIIAVTMVVLIIFEYLDDPFLLLTKPNNIDDDFLPIVEGIIFLTFAISALTLITIVIFFSVTVYFRKIGSDIKNENKEGHFNIQNTIEKYLRPSVDVHIGLLNVVQIATEVLAASADDHDAFITYYGAPALSGLEDDEDLFDYEGASDENMDMIQDKLKKYTQAKYDIDKKDIVIKRYIHLIDITEYHRRSSKVQKRYLRWMDKQAESLKTSVRYQFFNSMRAPRWGSSQSHIITNQSYLHIIGQGSAAIHIKGKEIVDKIKIKMDDSITQAQSDKNKPQLMDTTRLNSYLNELKGHTKLDHKQMLIFEIKSAKNNLIEKADIILKKKEHVISVKQNQDNIEKSIKSYRDQYEQLNIELELLEKKKEILDAIGYPIHTGNLSMKFHNQYDYELAKLKEIHITCIEQLAIINSMDDLMNKLVNLICHVAKIQNEKLTSMIIESIK